MSDTGVPQCYFLPGVEPEINGEFGSLLNPGVTAYVGRFASGID